MINEIDNYIAAILAITKHTNCTIVEAKRFLNSEFESQIDPEELRNEVISVYNEGWRYGAIEVIKLYAEAEEDTDSDNS